MTKLLVCHISHSGEKLQKICFQKSIRATLLKGLRVSIPSSIPDRLLWLEDSETDEIGSQVNSWKFLLKIDRFWLEFSFLRILKHAHNLWG